MLGERTQAILSWITILVVVTLVVSAMASILNILIRTERESSSLEIHPAEVTLCPGEQVLFTTESPLEGGEWAATGGTITADGHYIAGELPGNYEVRLAGPEGAQGRAVVHVVLCTPTPLLLPTPTTTPAPTSTPPPTPIAAADSQGDLVTYTGGAVAAQPPPGVDIRNASVAADRHVELATAQELPGQLAQWAQQGETILWIALYEPIPEVPPAYTEWLFVLDVDGNTSTGRPAGSRPINPDLGDEVAVAMFYDPTTETFDTYLLIWDPEMEDWQRAEGTRHSISEDRMLVGLALPLEALQQQVAEISGVTLVPDAVLGRAGAVAYIDPEAVLDFYPERP